MFNTIKTFERPLFFVNFYWRVTPHLLTCKSAHCGKLTANQVLHNARYANEKSATLVSLYVARLWKRIVPATPSQPTLYRYLEKIYFDGNQDYLAFQVSYTCTKVYGYYLSCNGKGALNTWTPRSSLVVYRGNSFSGSVG